MRVLYVAPRYHTNQIPVVKGWLENGDRVMFMSQFRSTPEDYSVLEPVVLGYYGWIEAAIHAVSRIRYGRQYTLEKEVAIKIKLGIPPLQKMKGYLKEFAPDVVILRERSLYNIPFYLYCRKRKISCILYNQSPVWDVPGRDNGLGHRILMQCLPRYRMTPVLGKAEKGNVKTENSFYVPFVIEPHIDKNARTYLSDGVIRIVCVGRYEDRKNLFMLIDVLNELKERYQLCTTIIGEATDDFQKDYYRRLQERVKEYGLEKEISLLKNLSQSEIYQAYREADLFVLPSTRERASVSQLEAMSCGVPVICSDTNGTSCYVIDGENGYVFRDMDKRDLKDKIECVVANKEKLVQMGRNGYNEVIEKYQFPNYRQKILDIIAKEKHDS